jgi:hypothetical protein
MPRSEETMPIQNAIRALNFRRDIFSSCLGEICISYYYKDFYGNFNAEVQQDITKEFPVSPLAIARAGNVQ